MTLDELDRRIESLERRFGCGCSYCTPGWEHDWTEACKAAAAECSDIEGLHLRTDRLMELACIKFGLREGVEAIRSTTRWYA